MATITTCDICNNELGQTSGFRIAIQPKVSSHSRGRNHEDVCTICATKIITAVEKVANERKGLFKKLFPMERK